ncbi:MAG: 2-hydroxyacyl-CoA dehydratase [Desulfobacteraceae bacterium]|nr:2-hydroxyacyl-CoA dehydratase [Desulfobacteraceae bacterium]
MTQPEINPRLLRLQLKTREQIKKETCDQAAKIKNRDDYIKALDPFLESLALSLFPKKFIEKAVIAPVMTMCIQAPMELFSAAGLPVFKLACGSHAAGNLAPLQFPALTCPMIKSLAGLLDPQSGLDLTRQRFVIPTTCDWVVKFSELTGLYGKADIHFMELPHLRENERSSRRWLEEIQALKSWLEKAGQGKITPKALHAAIQCHAKAFELFARLIELKRSQLMPAIHFALIANAFAYQDINFWKDNVRNYIDNLKPMENTLAPVLLIGSPIVFPNYKLLHLMENAGMAVAADDICSLERIFPGAVTFEDKSEYALLRALAERNHKACTCPTFADNERRINGIFNILEKEQIKGIIFHVLKGCHPYEMESGMLETQLKKKGYRFLKIETDYVKEDEQNIVTRLEAFRRTLGS